jgi:hypothetical protein
MSVPADWYDDARAAVEMIRAAMAGDRKAVKAAAGDRDPLGVAIALATLYGTDLKARAYVQPRGFAARHLRAISDQIDSAEAAISPAAAYGRAAERDA